MTRALSVKVVGGRELTRKLRWLEDSVAAQNLATATRSGALLIQNAAKEKAPYRTGNLRRSIHTEVTQSSRDRAVVEVGTDAEYAAAVEYGTGPYVIEPVNRKALYWKGAEHPVRRVHHPGVPAQPYMRPAFDENADAATTEVVAALRAQLLREVK